VVTGLDEVHAVLARIAARRRDPEPDRHRTRSERIRDAALARLATEREQARQATLTARRAPQETP
jgi:hypothetical protein